MIVVIIILLILMIVLIIIFTNDSGNNIDIINSYNSNTLGECNNIFKNYNIMNPEILNEISNCKENNIFFILNIKNILYFLYFYIIFIYYY